MRTINFLFSIIFFCNSIVCVSQNKFRLDLSFSGEDIDSVAVIVDNGIEEKEYILYDTELVIEDYYKTEYVSIQLFHPSSEGVVPFRECGFFIDSKPAAASVNLDHKGAPIIVKSENIIPFEDVGSNDFEKFTKKSNLDFWNYYNKNISNLGQIDSITDKAFELKKQHSLKILEAIQTLNVSYYSFWMFRRMISNHPDIKREVKEELLNDKFLTYKDTYEYDLARDNIIGSKIKINELIESFESIDYTTNQTINTNDIQKPLLIITWATWCSPCIRKILELKDISTNYPELNFLYLNFDKDVDRAKKMINARDFKGYHFSYLNEGISNIFLNQVIGKIYLLDRTSQVQYNLDLEPDPGFKRLEQQINLAFKSE